LIARGARRRADEAGRCVEDLDESVLAHLEDAGLLGRAEAVLDRAHGPVAALTLAFEGEDAVNEVLEDARAGERPLLGHVPDEQNRDALPLGDRDDPCRNLAHLTDRPGAARQLAGIERLHGVDHADLRALALERGEDAVEVGLGDCGHGEGANRQARGAQPDLRCRLLPGNVEGAPSGCREVAKRHVRERRLPDPRCAADEHDRAGNEAAAEHAVELTDPGQQARQLRGLDLGQRDRRQRRCRSSSDAPQRRGGSGFLDERVPFAAAGAASVPARLVVPAGRTDVDRGRARHRS